MVIAIDLFLHEIDKCLLIVLFQILLHLYFYNWYIVLFSCSMFNIRILFTMLYTNRKGCKLLICCCALEV